MARTRYLIDVLHQYSVLLILGVIAGISLANIDYHFYEQLVEYHPFGYDFTLFQRHITVHFLINEVLMVFFFGIAAKEITDSVLPGGALNPIQRAINPIFSTIGRRGCPSRYVLGPDHVILRRHRTFWRSGQRLGHSSGHRHRFGLAARPYGVRNVASRGQFLAAARCSRRRHRTAYHRGLLPQSRNSPSNLLGSCSPLEAWAQRLRCAGWESIPGGLT